MMSGSGPATGGLLSLVGTPIGNLDDVSVRVCDVLRRAHIILCEDTRVTAKLLERFDIHVPLKRCDKYSIKRRIPAIIEHLRSGKRLVLVSDAGMPAISDPGAVLVDAVRDADLCVEVVPGPSAVTCALAASGLMCDRFFFEGFLPRKQGECIRRIEMLAQIPAALVVYESPRRVVATLDLIARVMPDRRVALARELTKLHEEVVREKARVLAQHIASRAEKDGLKGECVIVVESPSYKEQRHMQVIKHAASPYNFEQTVQDESAVDVRKSALAKCIAQKFGIDRGLVYDLIVQTSVQNQTAAQNQGEKR